MTHQQFIRKQCPNYSWAKKEMFPKDLITLEISDLYYLMDRWADYQLSQRVDINPTRENLNVGGGGFLSPDE